MKIKINDDMFLPVAIQGEPGSYSHACVDRMFDEYNLIPCRSFNALFDELINENAMVAVCPVENSIAGTIIPSCDLISRYKEISIIGEYYLRINHCLIANKGMEIDSIKRVYSHEMAIRQCLNFLSDNNLEPVIFEDTAGSVKKIVTEKLYDCAAIASETAAKMYNAEVIKTDIQHNPDNYTRFWILIKDLKPKKDNDKMSLFFEPRHPTSSLANIFMLFDKNDIIVTSLTSRPIPDKIWKQHYYCDIRIDSSDKSKNVELLSMLVEKIKPETEFIRILGYYKQADTKI